MLPYLKPAPGDLYLLENLASLDPVNKMYQFIPIIDQLIAKNTFKTSIFSDMKFLVLNFYSVGTIKHGILIKGLRL